SYGPGSGGIFDDHIDLLHRGLSECLDQERRTGNCRTASKAHQSLLPNAGGNFLSGNRKNWAFITRERFAMNKTIIHYKKTITPTKERFQRTMPRRRGYLEAGKQQDASSP
ncbi:MAG: hypothetical protein ACI4P4_05320, partial [Faecousia sp.]